MVNLKEIKEVLKKLKNNNERVKYLKELLNEADNKELKQNIRDLIEDIRELEGVAQIETRGRVEWDLPEEETAEERTLERQVAFIPLPEEEKKEEVKVDYGLQSNVDLYQGRRTNEGGIRYESTNVRMDIDEGKSFIDRSEGFIERRVGEQFMGKDIKEPREEVIASMQRYETSQGPEDYAPSSVSQEVHKRERKRLRY